MALEKHLTTYLEVTYANAKSIHALQVSEESYIISSFISKSKSNETHDMGRIFPHPTIQNNNGTT